MEFEWIEGAAAGFAAAREVRLAVFVNEQGYSEEGEFDETDRTALHLVGYLLQRPVCTARLFTQGGGVYHVGRVAVCGECRGRGAGLQMMQIIVEKAKTLGAHSLVLDAQADKSDFYRRSGFALTGKKTLDEGNPHVEMRLVLRP
ncbi:MAG: GNAT family N-acetyltransferase [Oscillospiraceae bacterium]